MRDCEEYEITTSSRLRRNETETSAKLRGIQLKIPKNPVVKCEYEYFQSETLAKQLEVDTQV